MADQKKTLELDPELQHEIVVAALNLVVGVSKSVHKRIERQGDLSSNPGVRPRHLIALRKALDKIPPGGVATQQLH